MQVIGNARPGVLGRVRNAQATSVVNSISCRKGFLNSRLVRRASYPFRQLGLLVILILSIPQASLSTVHPQVVDRLGTQTSRIKYMSLI